METLLEIDGLRVHYPGVRGPVRAVDGLTLALRRGETYALVGESGCGKSAAALAIIRLVEPGKIVGGRIRLEGQDLLELPERDMRHVRGARIGFVFQEAVGGAEPGAAHWRPSGRGGARRTGACSRAEARAEAVRLLGLVALPDPGVAGPGLRRTSCRAG